MSSTVKRTVKGACGYNAKASKSIWGNALHSVPGLLEDHPGLRHDPSSVDFSTAVKGLQRQLFGSGASCDGMMGRGTWAQVLKCYDRVDDGANYWVMNDRRVAVDSNAVIVNYDQEGGLDLHKYGHFSSRGGAKIQHIVVHWGGLDPHHCHRVFSNPDRKVSSHAGIGIDPNDGLPKVYQYLDLNHKAWHAGPANTLSVGIDICQQPGLKWLSHYERNGYRVDVIDNPTDRGPNRVLSLDPTVAEAARAAIKSLCDVLNIPMRSPRGPDGLSETGEVFHGVMGKRELGRFEGVIGHHHIVQKKWDCACWWTDIMGD